ncbi:Rrf2 family transcriptional regulator [Streptosporangium sp. NPDC051022]|uniref:RrF2 family transcriptional regulator n=1 Tax=Streptosporangium sp. NPDC051022 TaxID=3155752 RepID=UPI003449FAB7
MHVTARSDYAIRAMLVIAAHDPVSVTAESLAHAQQIPPSFLRGILTDLRRANLVFAQRGNEGGFTLARRAESIFVGDVLRAVGGGFTSVRGFSTADIVYFGEAAPLRAVWLDVEASIGAVVDSVSLAALLAPQAGVPREQPA